MTRRDNGRSSAHELALELAGEALEERTRRRLDDEDDCPRTATVAEREAADRRLRDKAIFLGVDDD